MRSSLVPVVVLAAVIGLPLSAAAQPDEQAATTATSTTTQSSKATTQVGGERPSPASLKILNNVQIEITLSDQTGSGPIEKKTVSMIAASGTWGKVRAAGVARPNDRTGFVQVGLNVDARPFLFANEIVQVELTISYNPLGPQPLDSAAGVRPTELNQSMTVVLQNGRPLIVSQAADPVSDRKIIVEAKATILNLK